MSLKEFGVENNVAIVTGGGRGIGRAIALLLAEAGADVAVIARTAEQVEETADQVRKLGCKALPIPLDVTDEDNVKKAVHQVIEKFGRIDILCNNAGILRAHPVVVAEEEKITGWEGTFGNWEKPLNSESWQQTLSINLTSALYFAQSVGPHFIKQRKGKVVITSSTAAEEGSNYFSAYCVSKAGLSAFTRCLASEWGQFNITVNATAPGMINTDMIGHVVKNPAVMQDTIDIIPLGRLGEPREVAFLVLFLASKASDYITGQIITIDGGAMGRGPGI
jgi:NAD(P)-dependent dehydrogenase (short-subunit alcohol dehydrogenase family)